jgi:acyl carrier protein
MLPAAFVILDAFPLTPNGKIDRRALPAPQAGVRPDLASAFVAPRTPSEELLASIYARVLRVDRVGVEDSFFERGGHSLLATQAIVRVREAFGLDVPLLSLFERPTVAGMAAALADMLEDRATLDEIARAVMEVEALSDEEVQLRLACDSAPA